MTPIHTQHPRAQTGTVAAAPDAGERRDSTIRALGERDLAQVNALLREQLDGHAAVLTGVHGDLTEVTAALERAASRGKRLRASFCLWGARGAAAGELPPGAVETAAAIELFHLAALVHDDVMDHSDHRRGLRTVHGHFADLHHHGRRSGDAAAYGEAVAILVGDLCLTWSDDVLTDGVAGLERPTRDALRRMWSTMRDEAIAGQFLDVDAQTRAWTSVTTARLVLRFKSAKYTVSHPLRMGGALAGADADILAAYDDIGLAAGEAFQLRDDLLGVLGDPQVTGKPTIDDIREGKRTLLIGLAEEHAGRVQRRILDDSLGNPDVTDCQVAQVCEVLRDTGAVDMVEDRITQLAGEAFDRIDRVEIDEVARHALTALVTRCVWRSA